MYQFKMKILAHDFEHCTILALLDFKSHFLTSFCAGCVCVCVQGVCVWDLYSHGKSKCLLLPNQTLVFIIAGDCWCFYPSQILLAHHFSVVRVTVVFAEEQTESFNINTSTGFPGHWLSWPEQSMPPGLRSIKYWAGIAVGSKHSIYWLSGFFLEWRLSHMTCKMNWMCPLDTGKQAERDGAWWKAPSQDMSRQYSLLCWECGSQLPPSRFLALHRLSLAAVLIRSVQGKQTQTLTSTEGL